MKHRKKDSPQILLQWYLDALKYGCSVPSSAKDLWNARSWNKFRPSTNLHHKRSISRLARAAV